jgi:hypothetical protein
LREEVRNHAEARDKAEQASRAKSDSCDHEPRDPHPHDWHARHAAGAERH